MSKGFFPSSPVDLVKVLIEKDNIKVDVKKQVESIAIYEDINQSTITATLTLADGLGLIDNIPINGYEKVTIEWKMTGKDITNVNEFIVYKVSGQTPDKEHGIQVYTLNLCTPDKMKDINITLQKAYKGRYSDIAETVLKNKLGSSKGFSSIDSVGKHSPICCSWTPLEFCTWLSKRAYNESYSPYFFFENMSGYNFIDLKTLYDQSPVCQYVYNPYLNAKKQINPDLLEDHYFAIQEYTVLDSQDRMIQNYYGAFEENFQTLDLKSKSVNASYFTKDSIKSFLNEGGLEDELQGKRQKVRFGLTRSDASHKSLPTKNAMSNFMMENRLRIEVIGNDDLRVGQVIKVFFPSIEPRHDEVRPSKQLTGNYLITALSHMFNGKHYLTQMEICKDSREE